MYLDLCSRNLASPLATTESEVKCKLQIKYQKEVYIKWLLNLMFSWVEVVLLDYLGSLNCILISQSLLKILGYYSSSIYHGTSDSIFAASFKNIMRWSKTKIL